MDSFFFNLQDRAYKLTNIAKSSDAKINRVDVSNGIVYFDIFMSLDDDKILRVKNFDRMVFVVFVKNGSIDIKDNIGGGKNELGSKERGLFVSTKQDFEIMAKKNDNIEIFIVFVADFFIRRYLSVDESDPINFLYKLAQGQSSLSLVHKLPIDALSAYLIGQIIETDKSRKLVSLACENKITDYLIREFSLIDLAHKDDETTESVEVAKKAKDYLLENFQNPPTIKRLSRLCATNEFRLKKYFKQTYKTTIYAYIQNLKLEEANRLLLDRRYSVGEIASIVGYKHHGRFSKLFFESYGVYPKDILKSSSG